MAACRAEGPLGSGLSVQIGRWKPERAVRLRLRGPGALPAQAAVEADGRRFGLASRGEREPDGARPTIGIGATALEALLSAYDAALATADVRAPLGDAARSALLFVATCRSG